MPRISDFRDLGAFHWTYHFCRNPRRSGPPNEKHLTTCTCTCPPNMAPNDNWGADDFVLIDNPVRIVALQDAPGESSIESGYVTVSTDDATTAAKQDTPTAPTPAEYKQRMVEIKNFQPMPLRAFPEELSNTLLIGPFTNKHQDLDDKVNGPSCPVHLDEVLIKNSIVLFECFFHFKDLYPKIGRDNMLYMVGRACELSCADSTSLKQRVGRTLDALADGRAKFTRTYASDVDVSKPEDADVEELAWLVDEHVNLGLQEPQTVDDMWYKNPGIGSLWSAWQKVLKKKKRLAVTNGEKKNGKDNLIYSDVHSLTPPQRLPRIPTPDPSAAPSLRKPCRLPPDLVML